MVGKASSASDAAALPRGLNPDVVVMDFHLDDGTGHSASVAIRHSFPHTRFLCLSHDGSEHARLAAVQAGASAYVLKSSPAVEVNAAVRKVANGMSLITPG